MFWKCGARPYKNNARRRLSSGGRFLSALFVRRFLAEYYKLVAI
jgi:hypothetical protein